MIISPNLKIITNMEDMVKEACQQFSGLPQTVVRLWHAELVAHRIPNSNECQEEEHCIFPDAWTENTDSHDIPPLRSDYTYASSMLIPFVSSLLSR